MVMLGSAYLCLYIKGDILNGQVNGHLGVVLTCVSTSKVIPLMDR